MGLGLWYKTTLTRKGQVTIPAEIRRAMGLKEGDLLAFVLDGEEVRLAHWIDPVTRTAGIAKNDIPAASIAEEKEAYERAVAEEVIASMNR
jgi:AbrB family looped-hinge helix DNA binding protein